MSARTRRWRATVVRRLPVALMVYPFECFMALLGGLLGLSLLGGSIKPDSLFFVLPAYAVLVYAVSAVLGAATVALGLAKKAPIFMAVGLRLIALLIGLYGVAVVGYVGWRAGGFAALFFIGISVLAGFRAFYLRAEAEAAHLARPTGG